MPEKTIAIRVDEALFRRMKIRLAEQNITLKDYVTRLIEADLQERRPMGIAIPAYDGAISEESLVEAQKVLDFVSDVMSGKYGNEEK